LERRKRGERGLELRIGSGGTRLLLYDWEKNY
jgi:hypothetical protein